MDAIILAAGRGTRMQTLTDDTPKPLLHAAGRPLIAYQIEALVAAGAKRIVVNIAYLSERFASVLGDGTQFGVDLCYSQEPEDALETAGGIGLMLKRNLVRSDPFIVTNGDVYSDFDYSQLTLAQGDDAALVMVPNPDFHPNGDFHFLAGRLIKDDKEDGKDEQHAGNTTATNTASAAVPRLTFSGIGLYRQRLFDQLVAQPVRMKLAPILRDAISDNRVSAVQHDGYWVSVDTPDRLTALSSALSS